MTTNETLAVKLERVEQQAIATREAIAVKFKQHEDNVAAEFAVLRNEVRGVADDTRQLVELFKLGNSMLRLLKRLAGITVFIGTLWAAFKTGSILGLLGLGVHK